MATRSKTVRVPEEILNRIETHRRRMETDAPLGLRISETDAIVHLLALGLEVAEKQKRSKK